MIFAAHAAAETIVSVDAREYVLSDTFDVEINIKDVHELDSGEFHLIFDPNVVNVTDVVSGSIAGKTVEIVGVVDTRYDKIHGIGIIQVVFNIDGEGGASGSGSLSTISFEVTGGDGDCSFLNISNPTPIYHIEGFEKGALIGWDRDEITAEWGNGMVCIGDSNSGNSTDPNISTQDTPGAKVTIFVENRDDDDLFVKLSIDGDFEEQYEISDGDNKKYRDGRRLTEGLHTFKIEWRDHDTNKDYVKTKECSVSGTTAVTLMTDEHTEDDDKLSARVYVKNLDNDDLDVYLYLDEMYKKYKKISSNGSIGDYGEYEFEEDEDALHSFKIEWFDPGTDVTYEKIVRSYITTEEAVTLYVDKHTEEDIIILPDETPPPVSTHSTSTATTSQSASDSQPSIRNAPSSTTFHTDPTLSENFAGNNGLGQGITWHTLIGLIAVMFALIQIRRS
jgi:hypothetical protein